MSVTLLETPKTGAHTMIRSFNIGQEMFGTVLNYVINHIFSVSFVKCILRLAPVLKTIFHQCIISYTYSQSNSDGSVLTEPSKLDWLQVYDMIKQSHQS